jgi:hypothetical protein
MHTNGAFAGSRAPAPAGAGAGGRIAQINLAPLSLSWRALSWLEQRPQAAEHVVAGLIEGAADPAQYPTADADPWMRALITFLLARIAPDASGSITTDELLRAYRERASAGGEQYSDRRLKSAFRQLVALVFCTIQRNDVRRGRRRVRGWCGLSLKRIEDLDNPPAR